MSNVPARNSYVNFQGRLGARSPKLIFKTKVIVRIPLHSVKICPFLLSFFKRSCTHNPEAALQTDLETGPRGHVRGCKPRVCEILACYLTLLGLRNITNKWDQSTLPHRIVEKGSIYVMCLTP